MTATVTQIKRNETHVRRYVPEDIPIIIKMIMENVPDLPFYKGVKVEQSRLEFLLKTNIRDESAFAVNALVNGENEPVGFMAMYCVTNLLSWDKATGDIFIYIDPKWRSLPNVMSLLREYVVWAKRRGAKLIDTTHTSGYRAEGMDLVFRKHAKFENIGTIYRYVGP